MAVKKRYDVCLAKEIPDKNSREGKKTLWKNVGKMIVFDNNNIILDLNMFEKTFNVFEEKPRDNQRSGQTTQTAAQQPEEDAITVDDIPF